MRGLLKRGTAAGALLAAVALAACASLSPRECRSGDWAGIGLRDGSLGEPASLLALHRRACAGYAVAPDAAAYQRGYADGLARYCTAAGGYLAGRRGDLYQHVCSAQMEAAFLVPYQHGREIAARVQEMREQLRYMDRLQAVAAGGDPGTADRARRDQFETQHRFDDLRAETATMDRAYSTRYDVPPADPDVPRY